MMNSIERTVKPPLTDTSRKAISSLKLYIFNLP